MADLPITSLTEKTTPAVAGDFVVMIDSEDGNKVKKQEALQYKGPIGNTGPQGDAGLDGSDGTDGADGKTILNGIIDPVVGDGVDGDFFLNTVSNTIFGPKTAGVWGSGTTLVGPTGATGSAGADGSDGVDGLTLLNGTSNPTTQGVDGDFYINTTSNEIFGPKSGTWGTGTSLVGPTGNTGPAGPEGMNWTGAYSGIVTYSVDDAVSYNGSSYICIQANTGDLPTDPLFWDIFALKGEAGAGAGDMLKSTYDPTSKSADAFARTNHSGTQDSSTVTPELKIGTPVHIADLTSIISHIWSSTITDGGAITDNGNGTVSIDAGETTIRTVDTSHTPLYFATFSQSLNLALTDNATNYIYLNYNAGTPTIAVTLDPTAINLTTKIPMYVIVREGNTLSFLDVLDDGVDFVAKTRKRLFYTEKFIRGAGETGSIVSETGTRNLGCTAGEFFFGVKPYPHNAIDTSTAGSFEFHRLITGSWAKTNETQLDNVQFNNIATPGSEVLQTLAVNKYAVHWVYVINNNPSHYAVVYSQAEYNTLAEAEASSTPNQLPPSIEGLGELLGRYIILKNDTSGVMESVYTTIFSSTQAQTHNGLSGLQGGALNDYQHLTSAELSKLQGIDAIASKKSSLSAITPPAVTNDTTEGYDVGSVWIDITADEGFVCLDATTGNAVWLEITSQREVTLAGVETLTNKTLTAPKINVGSDATGDVYYRNASGIYTRLPVGTVGQVLTLAGGIPTWADAGGGGGSLAYFFVHCSNTVIDPGVLTKIAFTTGIIDTEGAYNSGTYEYTIPVTGVYEVHCQIRGNSQTLKKLQVRIDGGALVYANGGATDNITNVLRTKSYTAGDKIWISVRNDDSVTGHTSGGAGSYWRIRQIS